MEKTKQNEAKNPKRTPNYGSHRFGCTACGHSWIPQCMEEACPECGDLDHVYDLNEWGIPEDEW